MRKRLLSFLIIVVASVLFSSGTVKINWILKGDAMSLSEEFMVSKPLRHEGRLLHVIFKRGQLDYDYDTRAEDNVELVFVELVPVAVVELRTCGGFELSFMEEEVSEALYQEVFSVARRISDGESGAGYRELAFSLEEIVLILRVLEIL